MRRYGNLVLIGLLLVLIGPARADMGDLLQWQKVGDSGAYISSGYHDWRSVSRYRSRPGLHAGYDIAMLAGSAVRTPWSGTVVAITPWYGSEVGVTIQLSNGWKATFGHITTSVNIGQEVARGDVIGRVVVDHVDVKMRDRFGDHFDFGASRILAEMKAPQPGSASVEEVSIEEKRLAAAAFGSYQTLLTTLAAQEAKTKAGLLPAKAALESRAKLDKLRPLARLHAVLNNRKLPGVPAFKSIDQDSKRPVTDALLGFPTTLLNTTDEKGLDEKSL